MEEVTAVQRFYEATGGSCPYCEIVATEIDGEKRVVAENGRFVAISSYAARFPFETWVLPKAHEMAFEDLTDEERAPFAHIMKEVFGRINSVLDDPPLQPIRPFGAVQPEGDAVPRHGVRARDGVLH